ncbi:hypothetical protein EYF80_003582 [Liparis tanakae]|uniref:Uncharacterized protein n=1 Tax=Liparis tanakae TaxID=230148 RepID=A0A4Z2J724_9TELE|nr:hypothetical protein EYF80_003582 [Liparis tanakae]
MKGFRRLVEWIKKKNIQYLLTPGLGTYPVVIGWSWRMTWVLLGSSGSPSPSPFTINTSAMDTVTSSVVAITLRVILGSAVAIVAQSKGVT